MKTFYYRSVGCDGAPMGKFTLDGKGNERTREKAPHSCERAHVYYIEDTLSDPVLKNGYLVLCENCARLAKARYWKLRAEAKFESK